MRDGDLKPTSTPRMSREARGVLHRQVRAQDPVSPAYWEGFVRWRSLPSDVRGGLLDPLVPRPSSRVTPSLTVGPANYPTVTGPVDEGWERARLNRRSGILIRMKRLHEEVEAWRRSHTSRASFSLQIDAHQRRINELREKLEKLDEEELEGPRETRSDLRRPTSFTAVSANGAPVSASPVVAGATAAATAAATATAVASASATAAAAPPERGDAASWRARAPSGLPPDPPDEQMGAAALVALAATSPTAATTASPAAAAPSAEAGVAQPWTCPLGLGGPLPSLETLMAGASASAAADDTERTRRARPMRSAEAKQQRRLVLPEPYWGGWRPVA